MLYICRMHANVQSRYNPQIGETAPYYRLKESYRDIRGNVHSLIVLNIGFEPTLTPNQIRRIAEVLTERFKNRNQPTLFPLSAQLSDEEWTKAEHYWQRMVNEGMIDRFNKKENAALQEAERYVDINSVEHTDARNVGAEWLCKQTIDKLRLPEFLKSQDWSEKSIHTALSHLIVRTIYAPSELATWQFMRENSAACELYSGSQDWVPGINALYDVPDKLFEIKQELERHLRQQTDHLFNLKNHIVLFDLTNFYFEGSKRNSKKARFGRSKEKRDDCKLLVLALSINNEGFIRYSEILEGNTADPKSLPDMVEKLSAQQPVKKDKTLVVIDAGIATEDNLDLLKKAGYNYLCVSRTKPKDYVLSPGYQSVTVLDTKKQEITPRRVHQTRNDDYYLEIISPSKAMTEASMNRLWRERFELEMERINHSIKQKGGIKTYEKVVERTGRAIERYPSIARFHDIKYEQSAENPKQMERVCYDIKDAESFKYAPRGVYFLRANVADFDEKTTWDYYNLIREIESTNRQLKTDLNLRPIYHQKDSRSDAHIFFGLLAYWLVNAIRHQLKLQGDNAYWTEIVRRMSTQKLITTEAVNALGEKALLRQCSRPTKAAAKIYETLHLKPVPFRKIKICRSQTPPDHLAKSIYKRISQFKE